MLRPSTALHCCCCCGLFKRGLSDNRERSNSAPSPFSAIAEHSTAVVAQILELVGDGNLMDKANLSCSAISCVHGILVVSSFLQDWMAEKAVASRCFHLSSLLSYVLCFLSLASFFLSSMIPLPTTRYILQDVS